MNSFVDGDNGLLFHLPKILCQTVSKIKISSLVAKHLTLLFPFLPFSPPFCFFSPQFSLFGSRSTSRTTDPSSSSTSSPAPVILSAQMVKRADRLSGTGPPALSKAEFLERVRRSNQACQQGEFELAVRLYSEALTADPQNCILYSNRSAAYLRLGEYSTALDDAIKARLINPKWPKVRGWTLGQSHISNEIVLKLLFLRLS